MVTFKKKEIIYRPYETVLKIIVDVIMIVCLTYLIVVSFFNRTTISGHSMNNTLQNNDTVLINSIAYTFHGPERYDLVVFKSKLEENSNLYVKRIIGLPGETVQIKNGKVYIDNNPLEDDIVKEEIFNAGLASSPIKLAYNEYFVLGDNRNNSDDSRYSNIGNITRESIVGKPWLRIKPVSSFGIIKYKSMNTEVK